MSCSKEEHSHTGQAACSDTNTAKKNDQNSVGKSSVLTAGHEHDHEHYDHHEHHHDDHDHGHGHGHHHHDHGHEHSHDHSHGFEATDLIRIAAVGVFALCGYFGLWKSVASFDFFCLFATLVGGLPIFKEAFIALKHRRMTMELSMTIALVAALTIGEFLTAAFIVFFVLIAEVLEGLTVDRGHKAIEQLVEQLPDSVSVKTADDTIEKPISEVQPEEVIISKPGSMIPCDGIVTHGTSFVDQSSITGETTPVEKIVGAKVFAGTLNQRGYLEIQVETTGKNTVYGKVIKAISSAEESRAPVQKLADRLAGYLVYFAMISAVLTFIITGNIHSTISVIIVAGACGIAAGTPLALLGAIGRSARAGAIVKGARFIEQLAEVDTVIFDKTGTLTLGKPKVAKMNCFCELSEEEVLRYAASAESASEHPIADAIVAKAKEGKIETAQPEEFNYIPGQGVNCLIEGKTVCVGNRSLLEQNQVSFPDEAKHECDNTVVFVSIDSKLHATIEITDENREDASKTIDGIKALGLKTILLTGDSNNSAKLTADKLGIDQFTGELLPDQKADRVRELIENGAKVAMVGDGVNDAPAMLEATVGISVGSATELTKESSDIVLIGEELGKFLSILKLSKRCTGIIWFNFAGTILVDIAGIILAAFGMLTPLLAALIHVVSELTFILNSARLIPLNQKSDTTRS